MRALEKALKGRLQITVPLIRQRLGQNAEDRLIVLGTHVMTGLKHNWFPLMIAKMSCSVAL